MSLTIKELEKKSDFELSRIAYKRNCQYIADKTEGELKELFEQEVKRKLEKGTFNFSITSWADMGPIISNYGICLMSPIHHSTNDKWEASWNENGGRWNGGGDIRARHRDPLRAAATVYLMMD